MKLNNFVARFSKRIIDYNSILFPILWSLTIVFSIVEAFTYSGVIAKHMFLSFNFFLFLSITAGFLIKYTRSGTNYPLYKIILILNKPVFLLFSLLVIFFPILEVAHFRNYVFSTYHIHPHGLLWPWFLSSFFIFLDLDFLVLPNFRRLSSEIIIKRVLLLGLVSWVLATNFFTVSAGVIKNLYTIVRYPFASYDEKMRKQTGTPFYDYTLFIKENTPSDATILIPPQGYPWPQTGNMAYLRYFLYPRYLVNGREKEAGVDLKKEKIEFVLLAWGESSELQYGFTNGWPKFDLKAKQIIYMIDEQNKKIVPGDSRYDPEQKNLWGLIELDNQ